MLKDLLNEHKETKKFLISNIITLLKHSKTDEEVHHLAVILFLLTADESEKEIVDLLLAQEVD